MASMWDWQSNRSNSPLWIWIDQHPLLFWWLAVLSGLTFLISLILVPVIIARLPRDYFLRERPPMADEFQDHHPVVRWLLLIGKNLLGILLVLGGIAMSVPAIPGQGILTILIGLMLLNFPGKRRLERWIFKCAAVEKMVNWIRKKRGREPVFFPKEDSQPSDAVATSPKQQT